MWLFVRPTASPPPFSSRITGTHSRDTGILNVLYTVCLPRLLSPQIAGMIRTPHPRHKHHRLPDTHGLPLTLSFTPFTNTIQSRKKTQAAHLLEHSHLYPACPCSSPTHSCGLFMSLRHAWPCVSRSTK